ncbi:MAG: SurA N-terminal domain-containing protein [Coriobacteriia bacterium]|nr:SurA N-terminal domain-containing protein [Coriobacteriia bacterium]
MKKKRVSYKRNKWIVVAIAIVVLAAGALTAYLLLRQHTKTVAQVNGVAITQADIDQQTAFPLSQTPDIFDANGGAASKQDVDQRNLNAAINQQLLLQEAKKQGIKISGKVIDAAYSSLAKSYGTDAQLQDKLKQAGMTEAQLKTAVADNLTIAALTKSLVPDSSASDAKLQAYYNSHKDRYAGAGSFEELKDEIKADYLNDARSTAIDALVAQLVKNANIKK